MKSLIRSEARPYQDHIPEFLKDIIEIKALGAAIQVSMDKLYDAIDELIYNQYPDSMLVETVDRWERILNLSTPIDGTLESRRQAIKAKLLTKPPINLKTLKSVVEAYLGVEVNCSLLEKPYTINVTYRGLTSLPNLDPLYQTIYDLIPANMALEIEYAYVQWQEILSNQQTWGKVKERDWNYVLMGETDKGGIIDA